jgi:Ca-activated chloride channel family protein
MSEVVFDHPAWLLLLWLALPLGAALWYAEKRRRAAALAFAEAPMAERLMPPRAPARVLSRGACALLAFAALTVAAAGPRFGVFFEPVTERGADLVVLLDVSRSMLSEDVAPNRLERAKSDVRDLVGRVVGHRLGLVAFAGKAVVACPLTTDRSFFKSVLDSLGPRSAPRGGTAIGDALRVGLSALPPQHDRDQALLLITDGEDQDSYPLEAAAVAAERGVKIFTVGLGDPTEGARVPVEGENGGRTFLKHDGQEVWSKMQESLLTELATKTNGAYVPARTRAYDLGEIYEKRLADLATGAIREEKRKRLYPQFQLFLALGLGLSLLELLIAPPRRRALAAAAAALVLCGGLAPAARAGDASSDVEAGLAALNAGRIDEALQRLDAAAAAAPGDPRVLFDRGLAKERKPDFDGARADYLAAAAAADAAVAQKAQFNLGALAVKRAQQALGEKPEDAEPEKRKDAVERIEEAIRHFRTCLESRPDDAAARTRIEGLRVWLKGMQELWEKRDRAKERAKRNALQDLEWLFEQEAAVRDAARALAPQPDTPLKRAAVAALATRQRDLKEEIPPLQKKLVDEVQPMLGGAAPGAAGGGAPPNAPDPKQVEKIVQSLVQAAESSGAAMAKAATALDGAHFDVADAQGKEAQRPLDLLWLSLSSTEATLARGLKLAKDVVAKNEPLVPAADATTPPPDDEAKRAAAPRLAEIDERLAQTADVLGPMAQRQLDALAKPPPPAAQAPSPNPSPDPAPDPEALKKALARTVEVAPQVADLARAAQKDLATPDFAASLKSEREALALLEELEKLLPKHPQDDQNQGKKNQDDKKQDDSKKDGKQGDDSKKDDEKKNQDEKGSDGKSPQGEKPQMSPDQVQALLRRVAERAKQKQQEQKDAEESILVPVRVDRDW